MHNALLSTEFAPDDQPLLDTWFEHPTVGRWFPWYRGSARETGAGSGNGTRVVRTHRWLMRLTCTKEPVAFVAAEIAGPEIPGTREARHPYTAGLICVVAPGHQREGIGPASLTAAMDAPELGDVTEFRCAIDVANTASWKAAERLGFTHYESMTQPGGVVRYYRLSGPAAQQRVHHLPSE